VDDGRVRPDDRRELLVHPQRLRGDRDVEAVHLVTAVLLDRHVRLRAGHVLFFVPWLYAELQFNTAAPIVYTSP
jgi:hypothetical protein